MPDPTHEPGPLEAFLLETQPVLGRTFDGDNAGAIISAVHTALKEFSRALGPDTHAEAKELYERYRVEAFGGDYDNLIETTRRWFRLDGDVP